MYLSMKIIEGIYKAGIVQSNKPYLSEISESWFRKIVSARKMT